MPNSHRTVECLIEQLRNLQPQCEEVSHQTRRAVTARLQAIANESQWATFRGLKSEYLLAIAANAVYGAARQTTLGLFVDVCRLIQNAGTAVGQSAEERAIELVSWFGFIREIFCETGDPVVKTQLAAMQQRLAEQLFTHTASTSQQTVYAAVAESLRQRSFWNSAIANLVLSEFDRHPQYVNSDLSRRGWQSLFDAFLAYPADGREDSEDEEVAEMNRFLPMLRERQRALARLNSQ
jgi:hypothetical protein